MACVGRQPDEELVPGGLNEEVGGHVQQLGETVGHGVFDGSDRLDRHAVHLEDLISNKVDQMLTGQSHTDLVDDHTVVPLQDVDGHHVTADRADATGHCSERTGSVGQLHPDQVAAHDSTLGRLCVLTVSARLTDLLPPTTSRPGSTGGCAGWPRERLA